MDSTFLLVVAFVVTSALWAVVGLVAVGKVAAHCRGNPPATAALVEHILLPLFVWPSRKKEARLPSQPEKAEPTNNRL